MRWARMHVQLAMMCQLGLGPHALVHSAHVHALTHAHILTRMYSPPPPCLPFLRVPASLGGAAAGPLAFAAQGHASTGMEWAHGASGAGDLAHFGSGLASFGSGHGGGGLGLSRFGSAALMPGGDFLFDRDGAGMGEGGEGEGGMGSLLMPQPDVSALLLGEETMMGIAQAASDIAAVQAQAGHPQLPQPQPPQPPQCAYRTRARCDLRDMPIEQLEMALLEDWVSALGCPAGVPGVLYLVPPGARYLVTPGVFLAGARTEACLARG